MSDLSDIIQISISRETTSISRSGFGTPGIIAEFEQDKTTTTFDRYRNYSGLTEMTDDGWVSTDPVYIAASKVFSQNPVVTKILVGRKDRTDADWATALTAIENATSDWYGVIALTGGQATQTVFDSDFVASNSIQFTINGTAVTAVAFNTDQATTMDDIKTQIETDITGSKVVIDSSDLNNRTLYVDIDGEYVDSSVVVTGGASQPTGTESIISITVTRIVLSADLITDNVIATTIGGTEVTDVTYATSHVATMNAWIAEINSDISGSLAELFAGDANNRTVDIRTKGSRDVSVVTITGGVSQPTVAITRGMDAEMKEIAAWIETQKKIYVLSSNDPEIKSSSSTTDIAAFMESQNYDRTSVVYHSDNGDTFIEAGWIGETFPYDPGSQTWAYKTISGVASYELTSNERTNILAKDANIYTETAGVDITEQGTVASGEYLDIIRGIDWLEATIAENIFSELVNTRKVPYTNGGVTVIEGLLKESLDEGVTNGLITDDYVTDAPLVADIDSSEKLARNLPDVTFVATLQGAIHTVEIRGTVTA